MARPKEVRTLDEKIKLIEEIEKNPGEKRVNIAKRLGIAPSTLNTIFSKREDIRLQASRFGSSSKKRKTGRESNFRELEEILFSWYQQARASKIPVDGAILREKALQIALRLGVEDFTASNGWTTRFKERHGLVYKKLCGESAAVNVQTTDDWFTNLPKILEGYAPKDIYNGDETGLFFNCLPDKTIAVKGESCHGGKLSKERLTVLLCSNSDGSDQRKPIVIGKSKNPRCFKNIKILPVNYHANKNAWMTADIFTSFLRELDCKMGTLGRKILLFLDNCAAHPQDVSFLRNVKVVFYPPNCTSVCQPLDMGVIKCFKHHYRKMLVQKVVGLLDSKCDGTRVQMKLNVLQAVHYIAASWKKVTPTTISNCFAKCGVNNATSPSACDESDPESDHEDFSKLDEMNVGFSAYVDCDEEVATCIQSVENLCDARQEIQDSSDEDSDSGSIAQPETVQTFAEAHAALETLKTYCYSCKMSETDSDTLLKTESMLLRLRKSANAKQTSISDFFKKQ